MARNLHSTAGTRCRRSARAFVAITSVLLWASCGPDDITVPVINAPTIHDVQRVVPSAGLPAEARIDRANNNLDITRHDGRLFLAFRTAPNHFASDRTRLLVVSSEDEQTWRYEGEFSLGTDLREPRLLSWNGSLFLYFAVLGTNPFAFEPAGARVTRYQGPGIWSDPEPLYLEGFIPWRSKMVDGVPYMLGYVGGGSIYSESTEPITIHWLTTEDGMNWQPVVPGQPIVHSGGASEADFAFTARGDLVAVLRNEGGDEGGFGSKVCSASAENLGAWECSPDFRKFDSPLVFRDESDIYLVARRNVTPTGHYDLQRRDLDPELEPLSYQLTYANQFKRCSLWRVDPETRLVEWLRDFPSQGDTCFPAMVPLGEKQFLVYNYTSPTDQPEDSWVAGQLVETEIIRQVVSTDTQTPSMGPEAFGREETVSGCPGILICAVECGLAVPCTASCGDGASLADQGAFTRLLVCFSTAAAGSCSDVCDLASGDVDGACVGCAAQQCASEYFACQTG